MKRSIVALVALVAAGPLHAELVFEGYMIAGERTLLVLSDGEAGRSGWLALGQAFAGAKLVALRAEEETLVVERAGRRELLRLRRGAALESRGTRWRTATDFALAYELTQGGDKETAWLLKALLVRYEETLRAEIRWDEGKQTALDYLKEEIDRVAAEQAAHILGGAGR